MRYHFMCSPSSVKSRRLITELCETARGLGIKCSLSRAYAPCDVLVLYGLGGSDRYTVAMRHINQGGTVISFDIGYWERKLPLRKYRVSINGFHPDCVMQGPRPTGSRWSSAGLEIRGSGGEPDGPIMLVGNAPKSIAVGARSWTAKKSREIRKAFPGKKILYRPKPKRPREAAVEYDDLSTGPIDSDLSRCSLVVCRHSNVAVDACRLGVPAVCDDGAAAAIYPQKLAEIDRQPDHATRVEFLHRLAYWQWRHDEAQSFWVWLLKAFPHLDPRVGPDWPARK